MAITKQNIIDIAPALSTRPDAEFNAAIAAAARFINPRIWGEKTYDGEIYYAAHVMTLAVQGASAGQGTVTSETVGELSRTFSNVITPTKSPFGTTSYGRHLLWMLSTLAVSPLVVN